MRIAIIAMITSNSIKVNAPRGASLFIILAEHELKFTLELVQSLQCLIWRQDKSSLGTVVIAPAHDLACIVNGKCLVQFPTGGICGQAIKQVLHPGTE